MNILITINDRRIFKKEINSFLKDISLIGKDAVEFIQSLKNYSSIFLLGGAIRNLINKEKVRDIDIIAIRINEEFLQQHAKKYTVNRHGGYKVRLSKISIDLWPIDENWANKNELINTKYVMTKELAKGTFFNFDSLIYSIDSNILECNYYNSCVKKNTLDVIMYNSKYLYRNPTKHANILRAFYLKEKYGLKFSEKLNFYISTNIKYFNYRDNKSIEAFKDYLNAYPKYKPYLPQQKLEKILKGYI